MDKDSADELLAQAKTEFEALGEARALVKSHEEELLSLVSSIDGQIKALELKIKELSETRDSILNTTNEKQAPKRKSPSNARKRTNGATTAKTDSKPLGASQGAVQAEPKVERKAELVAEEKKPVALDNGLFDNIDFEDNNIFGPSNGEDVDFTSSIDATNDINEINF